MPLVLTDLGADEQLKIIFNNDRASAGNNLTLRLFATDVNPAQTGVTYVEASGGGYAAITLTMGAWTINTSEDPSMIEYAEQEFAFSGALTTNPNVYGYYVTDDDGVVWWAEKISTPYIPRIAPSFNCSFRNISYYYFMTIRRILRQSIV